MLATYRQAGGSIAAAGSMVLVVLAAVAVVDSILCP